MRKAFVLLAVAALAACGDRPPTDPGAVYQPALTNSAHSSQFFTFLSPLDPTPETGTFHPFADPRLDICRYEESGCVPVAFATLVDYSGTTGPILLNDGDELYSVTWADLRVLPRGTYRLAVSARPLNGSAPLRELGSTDVVLSEANDEGPPLQIEGNQLVVRFRIFVGAFCETSDCEEFAVDNDAGGQFLLEPNSGEGTLGLDFQPQFMCGENQTNCADGQVIVTLDRYRGPERCIPVGYAAIQSEACVTIRVEPYGVKVSGVTVGMCVEPRFDTYASTGHLRFLKVKESAAGVVQPNDIEDLNAQVGQSFFFDCNDEFDPALQPGGSGIGAADEGGLLSRLAAAATEAFAPLGRLLAPRPLHARIGRGPVIASLEDFSRLGPVLPVRAEFTPAGTIVGSPNTPLPAATAPRARVIATTIPGSSYPTTGERGVEGVQVFFTPTGGSTETVLTDANGYAIASWTLGSSAANPQTLDAAVTYPVPVLQNGDFPNFTTPWATHQFTALAQEFTVSFLAPLGNGSRGDNVASVSPTLRVCGPLANGASAAPGQSCDPSMTIVLPAPRLSSKGDYWSSAWKTDNAADDSLYRIDVLVNGFATGGFLLRRGGGGGSDPEGTYQFQTGSNLPIKFTLER